MGNLDFSHDFSKFKKHKNTVLQDDESVLSLEEVELRHIRLVLKTHRTLEDAAKTLGINLSTLWRKRQKYKI